MSNKLNGVKKIILKDLLAPTISTRQSVEEIAKKVPDGNIKIVVDFEGVEFVSRSFAHEFTRFQDKYPLVEVKNQSQNVKRMFEIAHQASSSKTWDEDITDSSINLSDFSPPS